MKNQSLVFVILLFLIIGITFSTINFALAQEERNIAEPGRSVIYYVKLLNANLVGVTVTEEFCVVSSPVSQDNQPNNISPPSCPAPIKSSYPITKPILSKNDITKYLSLSISRDSKEIPISIPIFSEDIVPASYCSRYVRLLAQQLYSICYPSKDAWNLRYVSTLEHYTLKEGETLSSLANRGLLIEGMIVGVTNPNSSYNNRIDDNREKAHYTHVMLYVGKSKNTNEHLFADLFLNEVRVLTESNLEDGFAPVEILWQKTIDGVNRCSPEPNNILSREEYYDNLLEFIRFEESERSKTGLRGVASDIWEDLEFANSYGPYQVKVAIARNLIDENLLKPVFGDKKSSELTDSQIISTLNDQSTGKIISTALIESNEKIYLAYTSKSQYTCRMPIYGSLDRYALEGAAYNSGISPPIIAGLKYSLSKAGVNFNSIEENERFRGTINENAKNIIDAWAKKEFNITLNFGTQKSSTKTYPNAGLNILSNSTFMEKFFEKYKSSTKEECIPLYIPYKDMLVVKLPAGLNYGVRVGKSASK